MRQGATPLLPRDPGSTVLSSHNSKSDFLTRTRFDHSNLSRSRRLCYGAGPQPSFQIFLNLLHAAYRPSTSATVFTCTEICQSHSLPLCPQARRPISAAPFRPSIHAHYSTTSDVGTRGDGIVARPSTTLHAPRFLGTSFPFLELLNHQVFELSYFIVLNFGAPHLHLFLFLSSRFKTSTIMAQSSAIEMEPSTKFTAVSVDSVSETKEVAYSSDPESKSVAQAYRDNDATDTSTLRVSKMNEIKFVPH